MHRTVIIASLVAACGTPAIATDLQHATVHHTEPGQTRVVGHVYYNASTGERVITRYAQPLGADQTDRPAQPGQRGADLNPLWLAQGGNPCPDGDAFPLYQADNPDRVPSEPGFARSTNALYLDQGGIPGDTLFEAFGGTYFAQHDDPNSTGVPGFGATFVWIEGDSEYGPFCEEGWHYTITLRDLPGNSGEFEFEGWDITVDLLADPANPMSIELGDTDGDHQGAAQSGPFSYQDWDLDGLHDFSHGIFFHQPGTFDFDGDGILDGNPASAAATYLLLVAPEGTVTHDPDEPDVDIFTDIAPLPSAQGLEDAFEIFINVTADTLYYPEYLGTYWFGGFNCPDASDPQPRPFASFAHRLYNFSSTAEPCPADVNGDGLVNFGDLVAYLGLFNSQDPAADLNDDGIVNFNDMVTFLGGFNDGCP